MCVSSYRVVAKICGDQKDPLRRYWFSVIVMRTIHIHMHMHMHTAHAQAQAHTPSKPPHSSPEEWNEFHHLLIMEALGGDQKW